MSDIPQALQAFASPTLQTSPAPQTSETPQSSQTSLPSPLEPTCPQQKWEYMEVTRKTEAFLVGEMNELGAEGWELVSVVKHRDGKGISEFLTWTAFLKRPSTGQHVPKALETLNARKELPVTATGEPEIFDVQG
jgi:hypothetical protein